MKLTISEAIEIGSKMGPQMFGQLRGPNNASCVVGAIRLAINYPNLYGVSVDATWPYYYKLVKTTVCPVCRKTSNILVHLNDDHRWSREAIAMFISTIEPAYIEQLTKGGHDGIERGHDSSSPIHAMGSVCDSILV